jgi:hypothetical protein
MALKIEHLQFLNEIEERGITHLIHFTPTINLMGIFEHGKILSRAMLERFDIETSDIFDYVEFTDTMRYDDKNYINLSIQHPNHFLFSRFQQKTCESSHISWCILKIDVNYICNNDTLFSVTNAANSHNKRVIGITGEFAKFRLMFTDNLQVITFNNQRTLKRGALSRKYTTDEQAEVLVKNEIPLADVQQICFKSEAECAAAKAALSLYDTRKFMVDPTLFSNNRI